MNQPKLELSGETYKKKQLTFNVWFIIGFNSIVILLFIAGFHVMIFTGEWAAPSSTSTSKWLSSVKHVVVCTKVTRE